MNAPLSGGAPPLTAVPPAPPVLQPATVAPAPIPAPVPATAAAPAAPGVSQILHLPSFISSVVKAELASLKTEAVTTEHKVGAAVLKYWPIPVGLVIAATRFL